jgi:penicillin amidase
VNLARFLLRLLLGRRLPQTHGSLRVAGLHGLVAIHRDRWGIPHIEADSEDDAYFAIGFCHGQDRTFQLELQQRVARGTLAEMVGPRALPVDRLSRRIGFHHAAARQWPHLAPDVQSMLQAYAAGVTAGGTVGLPRPPHEFALLRRRPSPWSPLDSLGLMKLISFNLASNWDVELVRLKVLQEDGPEALAAVDPVYASWLPVTMPPGQPAGKAIDALADDLALFAAVAQVGGGSNNWVVSPARTTTGRPLLANDPHLEARLPPHWYLVHVRTPQHSFAGATFLGGPSVQAGHNGVAAWGTTAGLVDNTDLFLEHLGPDGASVRESDCFVPCEVREEHIAIRGGGSVSERVLVTPRGPIISPALPECPTALSLRAVWLDPLPVDGQLRLHRVRRFEDFREAARHWPATSQSLVYADASGTIGYQLFGQVPRRRKGHGLLPAAGWDPEAGWEPDLVPLEQMPSAVNPEAGFLATANNQLVPDGSGPFLGADWLDGYRVASISRRLGERSDWDVPSTQALQMDQQALAWEDIRETVLSAPAADDDSRQALDLLRGWDGRVADDAPAASVYELFVAEMASRTVRARAPRAHAWALGRATGPLLPFNFFCYRRTGHLARLLRTQPPGWLPRPWGEEIAAALAAVVARLRREHGPDPARWGWGRIRPLVMHHPFTRAAPRLSTVFNFRPIPYGGDADTINQGAALPLDPLAPVDNIASLRMVVDVGAWHNSRFSLPGGQSGNPLSPHYEDLFPLWRRGEGVPIAWTPEEVRQATWATLRLEPADTRL